MYAQKIEWEEVKFEQKSNGHPKKENMVYLLKTNKNIYNQFKISPDLVEKLNWGDGTRVNLYKAGGLFKLSESKVGLIKFRMVGKTLTYTNWSMCAELHPDVNGAEFKAWVNGKDLYFSPKEVE